MADSVTADGVTAASAVDSVIDDELATAGGPSGGAPAGDERLAYRGVFQRMLTRPEIGAAIAAMAVWVFFWAVSVPFGKAGGAAQILDVTAAPLGIMAVAVAMLMIGGEFDLSAGAATGALGIITILLVRDVTGAMEGGGFSLWLALPISLLAALFLGWFNGTMVNKTSLPSFIVTLASFFILKGAKLGFSKLIVGQQQVGKLDDLEASEVGIEIDGVEETFNVFPPVADIITENVAAGNDPLLGLSSDALSTGDRGYGFLNSLFAAEWQRTEHVWEARDFFYIVGIVGGLAICVLALYEMHFVRKATQNPLGLGVFVAGVILSVVGVMTLHNTDSVGGNTTAALIIGAGMLVGFAGWALWRYQRRPSGGGFHFAGDAVRPLAAGALALVLSLLFATQLDAQSSENIGWLYIVTIQGARAIAFVGLALGAAVFFLMAASRCRRESQTAASAVLLLTAAITAAMAFFVRSQSLTPKFRTQAFTIMLVVAALIAVWAIVSLFFSERRAIDATADRAGMIMAAVGTAAVLMGLVSRLLWVTPAELEAGIALSKFSVRILWFFLFTIVASWVLARTRFGSWTFAVGGNKEAARQVGVPAARTKTQLFMLVSFAAWLVGLLLAFRLNNIQANTGDGEEFEYIIAAVVGGTMLTGGYGSTIGAAIGAFIMAMSVQGIPSSRWNSDWRFVFLGAILLTSVIANNFIRSKAEAAR